MRVLIPSVIDRMNGGNATAIERVDIDRQLELLIEERLGVRETKAVAIEPNFFSAYMKKDQVQLQGRSKICPRLLPLQKPIGYPERHGSALRRPMEVSVHGTNARAPFSDNSEAATSSSTSPRRFKSPIPALMMIPPTSLIVMLTRSVRGASLRFTSYERPADRWNKFLALRNTNSCRTCGRKAQSGSARL